MTRTDELRIRAATLQMQLGMVVLKARAALSAPPEEQAQALGELRMMVFEQQYDSPAVFAKEAAAIEAARNGTPR